MKLIIKDKEDKNILEKIKIEYNENPIEAVLNWCVNMGYKFVEIEYELKTK